MLSSERLQSTTTIAIITGLDMIRREHRCEQAVIAIYSILIIVKKLSSLHSVRFVK